MKERSVVGQRQNDRNDGRWRERHLATAGSGEGIVILWPVRRTGTTESSMEGDRSS